MPSASDFLENAKELGLLGSAPLEVHRNHALGFADALKGTRHEVPERLLDLGSGAGLPGIVLAEYFPKSSVTLLDSSDAKCRLLQGWVLEGGWDPRVSVACGRAEELGRDPKLRSTFDVVVARSFGRPSVTAECGSPFLRAGGLLVVSDPPEASTGGSDRWVPAGLEVLGLNIERQISQPFHFTVLRQRVECPDRYPRRTGIPTKRPLF
jgi:16S rRNA (guanine527-N7)-methyltransferase